jgi:lipoprotein-anchoring transpeptidase ErfK/SrfK
MVAVGSAAAISLLTMAGALGFGPGAAMAQTQRTPSSAATDSAPDHQSADRDAADPSVHATLDDGWLTYDDSMSKAPAAQPDETALPPRTGRGERIVYDISAQRVWLVSSDDSVERTYLVSGGKDESLLEPGRYHVYSMSPHAVSFNHKETMNYMVRFATGQHAPIGFHDVPARLDGTLVESRSELGTPQSSGCIRQWIDDARALWEFAEIDTPVVVTA